MSFTQAPEQGDARDNSAALGALIEWYSEQGIDVALDETPHNRFVVVDHAPIASTRDTSMQPMRSAEAMLRGAASSSATASGAQQTEVRIASVSPEEAIADAQRRCLSASSLDELHAALQSFDGCELKKTASHLVFGNGNPNARLMLIGEAPGDEDDRAGLPFVGSSGQLLDRMLACVGIARTDVYAAHIVPWRPPGKRPPSAMETSICLPFIQRQIELVAPDIVVCLGGPPAVALLGAKEGITKLRGQWIDYVAGERSIRALVMLHPKYILSQPLQKRVVWHDLLALKAAYSPPVH